MTEDELRHKYQELQKRHKEVRSRLAEKILENRELSRRVAKQDMCRINELVNEVRSYINNVLL